MTIKKNAKSATPVAAPVVEASATAATPVETSPATAPVNPANCQQVFELLLARVKK